MGNLIALAGTAHANQYGELHISSNTTLTDNRYGDIVFDVDNVTLDCAGHQVHISSYTRINGGQKVAIYASGKNGITIKNCSIVGGFDASIELESSANSVVRNVSASTTYLFVSNSNVNVSALTATGSIGLVICEDTWGVYSATVRCGFEGIHVYNSSNTMLTNTSVTGCSSDGIVGDGNSVLVIYDSDVEHNGNGGFLSNGSSYDDVENSVFSNNVNPYNGTGYGMAFYNGSYSFIYGNSAAGNGSCDAGQYSSSSMTWVDNTLGTTCGDVPAAH